MAVRAVESWRSALATLALRSVRVADRAFSYREAGTGEPMVFLHGISSGSGSWVHQLIHFESSARCVSWDAPGYGTSSALTNPWPSASDYERALASFLDALKIESSLIVAHSLGAIMATAFAARHPDRVRGMVLLDPAIGYGALPREEASARLDSRLSQLKDLGIEGLARTRASALVSDRAGQEAIGLIRWNMMRLSPDGYTQAARMLAASNLLKDAKFFKSRVFVACGTEDRITPEESCRQVALAFAQGQYLGLQGLGHASYIEAPPVVNERIAEFYMGTQND